MDYLGDFFQFLPVIVDWTEITGLRHLGAWRNQRTSTHALPWLITDLSYSSKSGKFTDDDITVAKIATSAGGKGSRCLTVRYCCTD